MLLIGSLSHLESGGFRGRPGRAVPGSQLPVLGSQFSVLGKVRWASGSDLEALYVEHGRDARATQASATASKCHTSKCNTSKCNVPDGIFCLPPDSAREKPTARSFARKSVELRMTSFTTLRWANRNSKTAGFAGGLSDPLERHFQLD